MSGQEQASARVRGCRWGHSYGHAAPHDTASATLGIDVGITIAKALLAFSCRLLDSYALGRASAQHDGAAEMPARHADGRLQPLQLQSRARTSRVTAEGRPLETSFYAFDADDDDGFSAGRRRH